MALTAAATSDFNSRPCVRGDLENSSARASTLTIFQFTPLREGRQQDLRKQTSSIIFQFTPLREGRQVSAAILTQKQRFQFTPLREGRLCLLSSTPFC